jgi:hypothetical protein
MGQEGRKRSVSQGLEGKAINTGRCHKGLTIGGKKYIIKIFNTSQNLKLSLGM